MKKAKSGSEMIGLLNLAKATTEKQFLKITAKLALDGFDNVVRLNPVDTGYSRSMWRVSTGVVDTTVLDFKPDSIKEKNSVQAPRFTAPNISLGDSIHIYNSSSYIEFLENGSSSQAPAGMAAITAEKLKIQADLLFAALSNKKDNV